jgi:mutual gliding-motility protein MglA
MASINRHKRELVFKIVFYGPGLGGKTTTLKYVHGATRPENRGNLLSLATDTDRTLYFDYLPVKLLKLGSMGVKLTLYTVPGQVYYAATRKLVLSGADGIVFVADTQAARFESNHESLEDLNANLAEQGRKLSSVPHAFQWNKRDLPALVSVDEADRRLNLFAAPSMQTIATTGEGVFETLERITRLVLDAYRADLPIAARTEGFPLFLDAEEVGLSDAIKGLADSQPARSPSSAEHAAALVAKAPAIEGTLPSNSLASRPSPSPRTGEPVAPVDVPTAERPAANPSVFSLSELWPAADREAVRHAEQALASGNVAAAVACCGDLLERVLSSTGTLLGGERQPKDPASVVTLLGLEGARYLAFIATLRGAKSHRVHTAREALDCYVFVTEARRALDRARAMM